MSDLGEIQHVTFDFDGERLAPWQAIQRLWKAGFTNAKELATGFAVMMGESGCYLEAWHHNCVRDSNGDLVLDAEGRFTVDSTDLGFIQKNVPHDPPVQLSIEPGESQAFVDSLFDKYPELARGDTSAVIARKLYLAAGKEWSPWFAFLNGSYKQSLVEGCVAVANFLGMALTGDREVAVRRGGS